MELAEILCILLEKTWNYRRFSVFSWRKHGITGDSLSSRGENMELPESLCILLEKTRN